MSGGSLGSEKAGQGLAASLRPKVYDGSSHAIFMEWSEYFSVWWGIMDPDGAALLTQMSEEKAEEGEKGGITTPIKSTVRVTRATVAERTLYTAEANQKLYGYLYMLTEKGARTVVATHKGDGQGAWKALQDRYMGENVGALMKVKDRLQ